MNPKVSIIMPCYNAAAYLPSTLAAIAAQTLGDYELIAVDDGSVDETPAILAAAAEKDPRIKVVTQANGGEGAARIAGFAQVTGEFLAHVDADDQIEPTLLEHAVARAEQTDADIVIFRVDSFDNATGETEPCDYAFRDYLAPADVFAPSEMADALFVSFCNWVWNKLFRMDFIREQGVEFIDVKRSADVCFTCCALASASRVALLDETLYRYRVNNAASALATSSVDPLGFYHGFLRVAEFLREKGLWERFKTGLGNWVNYSLFSNLSVTDEKGTDELLDAFRSEGLAAFELDTMPRRRFFSQSEHDFCKYIAGHSNDEVRAYASEMKRMRDEDEQLERAREFAGA